MEIYTADLISMAQESARVIEDRLNIYEYIIEDECVNLKKKICEALNDRIGDAFANILDGIAVHPNSIEAFRKAELETQLYKIINDL